MSWEIGFQLRCDGFFPQKEKPSSMPRPQLRVCRHEKNRGIENPQGASVRLAKGLTIHSGGEGVLTWKNIRRDLYWGLYQ